MPAAKKGGKKSGTAAKKPAAKPAEKPQAEDPGQTQPVQQSDTPDKDAGVVTDDAGRPETHDNFGDEDTGEE